MASEFGENRYRKYSQPSLDLIFVDGRESLNDRVGNVAVEFTRTQDTQSSYYKSDGTIGYASTDVARFDHDPTTGESLGLLIEESRTNRIQYGNEPSRGANANNSVFEYNYGLSPDGTFTAVRWRPPSGLVDPGSSSITTRLYKPVNTTAGDVVTISIYVKPIQTISRYINPPDTTEADRDVYLHIYADQGPGLGYVNLTTLTPSAGVTVQAVANGWYRVSGTYTASGNDNDDNQFVAISNRTTQSFDPYPTGDEEVLIWGFQVETSSFVTSFIPTLATFTSRASEATFYNENGIVSTASTDVARDDAYFPDENGNFISAGLLLEEERDNILLHSKDFSSTWDGSTNGTLTLNATTSPDGTNNAALFQNDGLGNSFLGRGLFQTFTGIGATTPMVGSVYVKNNDASLFTFGLGSLNNRFANIQFDFSTETVTSLSDGGRGSTMSSKVDKLPNDWYRLSFSLTTVDIGVSRIVLNADTGNDTTSVYVWGAQLEVNNDEVGNLNFIEQSTSYIPTTSGISTRAADISSSGISTRGADTASITGAGFSSFYNQSEGTWFVNYEATFGKEDTTVFQFNTANNSMFSYKNTNRVQFRYGGPFIYSATATTTNDYVKAALFYESDGTYGGSFEGTAVVSGAGTSNTATELKLAPFPGASGALQSSTNHISRLTYWPRRLPDSDLQRLTE